MKRREALPGLVAIFGIELELAKNIPDNSTCNLIFNIIWRSSQFSSATNRRRAAELFQTLPQQNQCSSRAGISLLDYLHIFRMFSGTESFWEGIFLRDA